MRHAPELPLRPAPEPPAGSRSRPAKERTGRAARSAPSRPPVRLRGPSALRRVGPGRWLAGLASAGLALLAAGGAAAQSCAHWTPLRQPFFGDLHVHTELSFDAWVFDTRNGPRDAYRFARGEEVGLPPLDAFGEPTRVHRLRIPLDFAAVTDHAEMLGETWLCTEAGLEAPACSAFQSGALGSIFATFASQLQSPMPQRQAFCGPEDVVCLAAASSVWGDIQLAAAEFDDPDGDCSFTSFVAYEWTATPAQDTLHRNVVFRNASVPPIPLSYVEASTPSDLWEGLEMQCAFAGGGCEALTIPHNSNLSDGRSLLATEPDGSPIGFASAFLRNRAEPLAEIVQHKGDSECRTGVGTTDELCSFEKLSFLPAIADAPLNYVRNALVAGLEIEQRIGVNPLALGLIGSTDTHNGTPGAAIEDDFPGHAGTIDGTPTGRLQSGWASMNPGGLVVLWAEENTRDALFDAMQRREAYATSGTRPELRFFAGFDLPSGLCQAPDPVAQAYASGVPMGGSLAAAPSQTAPRFLVQASQDPGSPGHPGTPLAEIQIVKGWIDAQGATHESVVSIAGAPPAPGAVDPLTCETDGGGAATLCAEWQDPDFDPDEHAFYYVRLLESPTCRWSTHLCREQGVDCTSAPPPGLEACCDGSVPETIQERATSSPIWVRPLPEPGTAVALAVGSGMLATVGRRRRSARRAEPGSGDAAHRA